jgi:hypothetical protein
MNIFSYVFIARTMHSDASHREASNVHEEPRRLQRTQPEGFASLLAYLAQPSFPTATTTTSTSTTTSQEPPASTSFSSSSSASVSSSASSAGAAAAGDVVEGQHGAYDWIFCFCFFAMFVYAHTAILSRLISLCNRRLVGADGEL